MQAVVYHYSVSSIEDHLRKVETYSTLGAKELIAKKKKISYFSIFVNPFSRFLKHYIFKRGFLDGYAGLVIASLSAYSVYLKYLKAIKQKVESSK